MLCRTTLLMTLIAASSWRDDNASSRGIPLSTRGQASEAVGRYSYGWQRSYLVPCGSTERWWVTAGRDSIIIRLHHELAKLHPHSESSPWHGSVFARFRGDTSALGHYGHLGKYRRQFLLKDLIEVRDTTSNDCK